MLDYLQPIATYGVNSFGRGLQEVKKFVTLCETYQRHKKRL
jgi:hypothetical protein